MCAARLNYLMLETQVGRECRRRVGEAVAVQVMESCLLQTDGEFSKVSTEVISHWGISDEPLL